MRKRGKEGERGVIPQKTTRRKRKDGQVGERERWRRKVSHGVSERRIIYHAKAGKNGKES